MAQNKRVTTNFPHWSLGMTQGSLSIGAGTKRSFPTLQLAHRFHDVVLAVRLWDFHAPSINQSINHSVRFRNTMEE